MKKQSSSTVESSTPSELEVVIIKKSQGICSKEIKMKLPSDTTFGCIIKFMQQQGLLKTRNAVVRPAHNQNHIIGHNRRIEECYNVIKLRFIVEEINDSKPRQQKIQALRNQEQYYSDSAEKSNVCGREQCRIM